MEGEEVMAPPAGLTPPSQTAKAKKTNNRVKRKSSVSSLAGGSVTPEGSISRRRSLRRGSSFTFLTPGTQWDFTLKRKRREKEDDSLSLCSFDFKEPSTKRVRPLARVTSLANLISPVRNGAVRRFGQTIQSFAMRTENKSPGSNQRSCSRVAAPTPPKRRNSVLWSEMLDINMKETLSTKEIKRQEAMSAVKIFSSHRTK
ncbi:hypothetical protein GDO86_006014 [Hymenochirus boettgeri]|uniref:Uncharacterized protein n=1 Tax=Hymenochirus boettgeri TaxID=247094 RepID=A0A8T2J8Z3_9PIPI|nr:hypothetical protein GDO86_006014 [Hymenochirus boettgeri]